jgi:sulfotransferase family protein
MRLHAIPSLAIDRQVLRRPNLFCVGAMKSGTSYFSGLLASHPAVFICAPREPCYFSDPRQLRRVWPLAWKRGYWRSESQYLRLFAGAAGAKYLGESSTTYTKAPVIASAAARIHAFAPDARIIYLMRDPVERTISHYWHMVRWHFEYRDPLIAIRTDPYYTSVSHYARQLAPYVEHFGRAAVHAFTYEQLIANPMATLRNVYSWLGIDSEFSPPAIDDAVNVTPEVVERARVYGMLKRARQSAGWAVVAPWVPAALRRRLSHIAVERVSPAATPMRDVIEYLRPLQTAQTRELTALLGRSFGEWTTLAPSHLSTGAFAIAAARAAADEPAT